MAENVIARGSGHHSPASALTATSDIPLTISPPSLLMSTSPTPSTTTATTSGTSFSTSSSAVSVPPLPLVSTRVTPSVISRPTKRRVRPRATSEQEKQVRLEERKVANRAAAKLSRERQKVAMNEALQENERLKLENEELLARLAKLEQRMHAMEQQQQEQRLAAESNNADVVPMLVDEGSSTHQSARPMSLPTEPQCPIPSSPMMTTTSPPLSRLSSMTASMPTSRASTPLSGAATASTTTTHRLTSLQTRTIIYVLQMLMHSFALSIQFRIPLTRFLSSTLRSQMNNPGRLLPPQYPLLNTMLLPLCSPWMTRQLPGYATPSPALSGVDLSGATRATVGRNLRELGAKNMLMASALLRRRRTGGEVACYKDLLRRVKRLGNMGHSSSIRLIIKKKNGKRMNK